MADQMQLLSELLSSLLFSDLDSCDLRQFKLWPTLNPKGRQDQEEID